MYGKIKAKGKAPFKNCFATAKKEFDILCQQIKDTNLTAVCHLKF